MFSEGGEYPGLFRYTERDFRVLTVPRSSKVPGEYNGGVTQRIDDDRYMSASFALHEPRFI